MQGERIFSENAGHANPGRLATVVSLGCAKNLVDSEIMVSQLVSAGYTMTSDASEAGLILVNTCGFLESAVKEAIENILELAVHKDAGPCECLVVAGCMVQRYGKKLVESLPEVDIFLGTSHYHELGEILRARERGVRNRLWIAPPRFVATSGEHRTRSTGSSSAYLKIAEGCSNNCAFCLIPHLRGPYRSRTVADVLKEASALASEGVKEINLIAQDTTAFGSDLGDPNALIRLIEGLDKLEGLEWVRILYAYPDRITDALLRTMARSEKVVPYLDIPLQHCVPNVLRAMRRDGGPYATVDELIGLIRSHIPDIALRTSLMVGFPGETEADFEELLAFLKRIEFDHAGVFAFSPEAGTRAARLPDQVDEKTRNRRRRALLAAQRGISKKRLKRLIGKTLPVLVEGPHPETDLLLLGRLSTQAPEVDGTVIITSGTGVRGEIMPARITASHDYDLEAELAETPCPVEGECTPLNRSEGITNQML